ncbi:hypothetical protein [Luteimonas sp. MC1828]|uniref:hypothetical protein n=1 Tax=Luteimonas sp. MC1828 TaxID=2799787 RepID=UPI0018F1FAE1|nr:hypothetical protein [Luteimonas sp. MC1828]MBJ7575461.1 hypothetical protein [Luteimonas sp. MC1828]
MRDIAAACSLFISLSLSGCESIDAIGQVVSGATACHVTRSKNVFPAQGEQRRLSISFDLFQGNKKTSYQDTLTCRYENSICGDGKWIPIWRESKEIGGEWQLSKDTLLTHHYYSYCADAIEYLDGCQSGACVSTNIAFKQFVVEVNDDPKLLRETEVTAYGAEIKNYTVKYADGL